MRYLPKSDSERQEMLAACGFTRSEELFQQLPKDAVLDRPLNIAAGVSEYEIIDFFREQSARNANG